MTGRTQSSAGLIMSSPNIEVVCREALETRLEAWAGRELRRREALAKKNAGQKNGGQIAFPVAEASRLFSLPDSVVRRVLRERCNCMVQKVCP